MRALLFTTERNWTGIARFPAALHAAGFEVGCLCDSTSYIARSRFVDRRYALKVFRPGDELLRELADAVLDWRPDRVIPGDEGAVRFLHRVATLGTGGRLRHLPADVLHAIRASLGDPARYDDTVSKLATQAAAARLGVRVPESRPVSSVRETLEFAREHGFPVVLKKAYGTGGAGVHVSDDLADLERIAQEWVHEPPPASLAGEIRAAMRSHALLPGLKRLARDVVEHRTELAHPDDQLGLSVQRFVHGTPVMHAVSAHAGRRLASLNGFILLKNPPIIGPATIMRFRARPDIAEFATTMLRHYGFEGFGSFDFVVEDGTDLPYLIEFNPRPVPAMHLGPRVGVDLCGSLRDAIGGADAPPQASTREMTVTLYPQEMRRDPVHPRLDTDLHDVPEDDPGLKAAYEELIRREAAKRA